MGLGSTAKKVSKLSDLAETLFKQMQDVRERITGMEQDLGTTAERVEAIEAEQQRQRALLAALADEHDVDVDEVLADVDVSTTDAESDEGADADGATADGSTTDAESTADDAPAQSE